MRGKALERNRGNVGALVLSGDPLTDGALLALARLLLEIAARPALSHSPANSSSHPDAHVGVGKNASVLEEGTS